MWVLRLSTLALGAISTGAALAMIAVKSALDQWWNLAGIFSGGILGLFLLGRITRRADGVVGLFATICGLPVILWMTLLPRTPEHSEWWRSPFHPLLTIVFGTLTILCVGLVLSRFRAVSEPA